MAPNIDNLYTVLRELAIAGQPQTYTQQRSSVG